jgi:hypothetical protein
MQTCDRIKASTSPLSFEPIFQFPRIAQRQLLILPGDPPRTTSLCPARLATVVLFESAREIIGEADVKFSLAVLKNVNAISCQCGKLIWLRGRDLNPRPSGYEPDELPGCSTPRLRVRIIAILNTKSNCKSVQVPIRNVSTIGLHPLAKESRQLQIASDYFLRQPFCDKFSQLGSIIRRESDHSNFVGKADTILYCVIGGG